MLETIPEDPEEPDEASDAEEPGDELPELLKQYPEETPIADNVDQEEVEE